MIQLGYDDALTRAAEIRDFLKLTYTRQFRTPRERASTLARNRDA